MPSSPPQLYPGRDRLPFPGPCLRETALPMSSIGHVLLLDLAISVVGRIFVLLRRSQGPASGASARSAGGSARAGSQCRAPAAPRRHCSEPRYARVLLGAGHSAVQQCARIRASGMPICWVAVYVATASGRRVLSRQADVLGRDDNHAAGDEQRILAGLEASAQGSRARRPYPSRGRTCGMPILCHNAGRRRGHTRGSWSEMP